MDYIVDLEASPREATPDTAGSKSSVVLLDLCTLERRSLGHNLFSM